MRCTALVALLGLAASVCPDLASLRSPFIAANYSPNAARGLWYENRYTDLAQIGATCQRMNKTVCADAVSICESYGVYYGTLPFDIPLVYNASGLPLGVSARALQGLSVLSFPSVVVDATLDPSTGAYDTLTEYLCSSIPILNLDYVEVRLSTRSAQPAAGVLDAMEARARALGVTWSGNLTQVNFTGCPAFTVDDHHAVPRGLPILRAPARFAARAAQVAAAVEAVIVTDLSTVRSAAAPAPPCDPNANASDIVLPGIQPGKPQIALIFIQGATVIPACYTSLLMLIQTSLPQYNVIVGAPAAPLLNTPDPLTIGADVARITSAMVSQAGLDTTTATFVYAAHSLGGEILQDWLVNATTANASALVLTGSYITRANRAVNDSMVPYFVPTLSLVGEQDGLARVSRFAEAYWHQEIHGSYGAPWDFPVVVLPGMNHGQFAYFNGTPPGLVGVFDLPAEVPHDVAQTAAADVIAAFIASSVGGNTTARAALQAYVESTGAFLAPLIESQVMESSYNLLPPCYDNPPSAACIVGCPWSQRAQALLANAASSNGSGSYAYGMIVEDAMHPVDDLTPIHLPAIHNNCTAPAGCALNASTVTEQTYDPIWSSFDVALYPCTAQESKVKMTSQQNALVSAGVLDANFTLTDQIPNRCAQVNAATLAWAVANAGNKTAARYNATGLPLVMGPDTDAYIGPQFTYGTLNFTFFNASTSGTGAPLVLVGSVTLRTPLDYIIPESAGFHYCLLLSPARAMEWVYVDSQRAFLLD